MEQSVQPQHVAPPPPLAADVALYLDVDGTLIDFAPRPESVRVPPAVPQLLVRLQQRLAGAIAVITGRRLADVDALLAPAVLAGAGVHGAELRAQPGGAVALRKPLGIAALAQALRERIADDLRIIVEDKGAAIALHYRLAPERRGECLALMRELAQGHAFQVLEGNMVVEARAPGIDKGAAIRALATQPPFAGRRPVFVGDDRTDEDGFAAVAAMGGHAVKVGPGPSVARYRSATVSDVLDWLQRSLP